MAFTLICHACGQKVTLYDIDVKKRKGTVRCLRCGARIPYDLDKRRIQQSGFWAAEENPFDSRSRNRLMKQLEREQNRSGKDIAGPAPAPRLPENNSFSAPAGFAKFDIKTGRIGEAPASAAGKGPAPKAPASPAPGFAQASSAAAAPRKAAAAVQAPKTAAPPPVSSSPARRVMIRAVRPAVPAVPSVTPAKAVPPEKKTFTAPPRIVTRTAHRHMTLVRTAQRAAAPKTPVQLTGTGKQSLWQRIKNFFLRSK